MAKKGDSGCAPLIVVGVIVFAIGKCAGGPSNEVSSPQSLLTAPQEASAPELTSLYVQTKSLKCRARPSRKSAIVSKFVRGDQVSISSYSGDWALVPQGGDQDCWVASQNLGESAPNDSGVAAVAAPLAVSSSTRRDRSNDGPTCGAKWKCGQMDSCEEANHYLNQCGLGRLDGDGDGVPCESIC